MGPQDSVYSLFCYFFFIWAEEVIQKFSLKYDIIYMYNL